MKFNIPTIGIILMYFAPLVAGIVINQLNPNMATALGVAYFALSGLILGVLSTGIAAALSLKWTSVRPNYLIVGFAFIVGLGLFFVANGGGLSSVG